MNYLLLFIFSLFSLTLQGEPLNKTSALEHFYTNINDLNEKQIKYKISTQSKKFDDKFTMLLYNGNTFAASIRFYFKKDSKAYQGEKGVFEIQGVHSSNIIKEINNYYEQEMNLQWNLFPELIKRIGERELDDDGNLVQKPFYLNMMEDIRQNLQENNQKNGVEFKVKFEDEDYTFLDGSQSTTKVTRMTLNSRESVIANIDVVIDKEEDKENSFNFQKTKYYLVIQAITATNDQENINIKIPMISRDANDFKDAMQKINDVINLKNYSNNNKEHYLNLQAYMQQKLKNIKFNTQSDLDKDFDKIKFDMKFENSTGNGELSYIAPSRNNKIGSYNLKIWKDGSLQKDFDFNRMLNQELLDLFFEKKVHNIFQSLYDFIMEIFIEKHKQIIEPQYPSWTIENYYQSGGLFNSAQSGFHHKNVFKFICNVSTDTITVSYYAQNVKGFEIEHVFAKADFDPEVEKLFIDYLLKGHLEFMKDDRIIV